MFRLSAFVGLLALLSCVTGSPSETLNQRTGTQNTNLLRYSAQDVVRKLGLVPNAEKGYYIQTFEDVKVNNRTTSTAIYYLLEGAVGPSYWHRVDAVEVWHYYAGAPLTLSLSWNNGTKNEVKTLGPDVFRGQQPQVVIEKWQWQSAKSLGLWTLVGTTMAPGFSPDGFEMHTEPDWQPQGA